MAAERAGVGATAAATLEPGYFALVMATGIVSVGIGDRVLGVLSMALLWIAVAGYAVLVVLTGRRLLAFRGGVRADLADPRRAFGFFTFAAGTDVLGTRVAADGHTSAALVLLTVGGLSWLLLGYLIPWTAVLGRPGRPVLAEANGTWFIWVVAGQSVAVLAATLEPVTAGARRELALLAVCSWAIGVFLYGAIGVLVVTRFLLHPLRPADLTPAYWVAMGATAITVVAGSRIVQMADAPVVTATRGLTAATSVMFWAFGTWLIPALLAAGWWRHIARRTPLRYEASLWSIVFPLGMYGVAGHDLGRANHLPLVRDIGAQEIWVALAVWAVTFAAMLVHLARRAGAVRSHVGPGRGTGAVGGAPRPRGRGSGG